MKPWALDDLVVNDEGDWLSVLRGATGLAAVNAAQSERYGAWPTIGGVTRPGKRFPMETYLDRVTDLTAARRLLMQYTSPEREVKRRLLAADNVLPGVAPQSLSLLVGPWDVARVGATYAPRCLLTQDEGTVTGGALFPLQNGAQLAAATTNLIINPSLETNATGWTWGANAQGAGYGRSSDCAYTGYYSAKAVCSGVGLRTIYCSFTRGANDDITVYTWVRTLTGTANLRVTVYDSAFANGASGTITSVGTTWTRIGVSIADATMDGWTGGGTSLRLMIVNTDATGTPTWYADGIQAEALSYATPYCDGSVGPGHIWTGTVHGSTSSRTAATLKFANPLSATAGSLMLTWTPACDNTGPTMYLFSEGGLLAYFNSADDKIYFTDGTNTISTAALTFSALVAQKLVFTWTSGALAIYRNGASAASGATYTAPTLGTYLFLGSDAAGANQANGWIDAARTASVAWTAAQAAAIYALADSNARWVNVLAEACQNLNAGGKAIPHAMVSSLVVDDDIRWRSRDGATFWRVYGDTGSCVVDNGGDDDAKPIFYFTPKTAKTTGWNYKVWLPIIWRASAGATKYPVDIVNENLDAGALVAASKLQADYDDLRVVVDGTEADRWLATAVVEDCEDAWNESVDADFTVTTPAGKIGNCNKFAIAAGASAGDFVTEAITATDLSGFTSVFAWVKCSINTAAGNFKLLLDNTASCASPLETINIPALTANTWTRVELTLAAAASDTAIISVGIEYDADIGACDFYIDDIRTATKVWSNFDFQAATTGTLGVALDSDDEEVVSSTAIDLFPDAGTLYIGTEAITYTGKNVADKTFLGCGRAAKGTLAAAHSISDTIYWIQHDVWLKYGNPSATAPTVDSNNEPAFELDRSTNTSWAYEEFGEVDGLRSGAWTVSAYSYYTANHNTDADPFSEMGIRAMSLGGGSYWKFYNPCGITNVNFSNGERYRAHHIWGGTYGPEYWTTCDVRSSENAATWTTLYTIPIPTADVTWETWSHNGAVTNTHKYIGLYMLSTEVYSTALVEVSDVDVTLNSTYTPTTAIGAEQTTYTLDVTLTNETTGDAIELALEMKLDQVLEVDTDSKTITLLNDMSVQLQCLTQVGGAREEWLRLEAGENTLQFSDTGTTGIEIDLLFDRRFKE